MTDTMKKMSRWAKNNPNTSRIIIGCSHLLVVINAICLGILLFIGDFGVSKWLLPIFANLFFLAFVFYPEVTKKKENGKRDSYIRQKAHDFSLVVCYAMVIALGFNNFLTQDKRDFNLAPQPTAKLIVHKLNPQNETTNRKLSKSEIKEKFKQIKKQVKAELHQLKKEYNKKNEDFGSVMLQMLLIMLTVAIILVLGYLVAILACQISCSGQEGLAWLVLIVGWVGLIWLGIIAIKAIFRISLGNKQMPIMPQDT